jgi:hypothetical protein
MGVAKFRFKTFAFEKMGEALATGFSPEWGVNGRFQQRSGTALHKGGNRTDLPPATEVTSLLFSVIWSGPAHRFRLFSLTRAAQDPIALTIQPVRWCATTDLHQPVEAETQLLPCFLGHVLYKQDGKADG